MPLGHDRQMELLPSYESMMAMRSSPRITMHLSLSLQFIWVWGSRSSAKLCTATFGSTYPVRSVCTVQRTDLAIGKF